jgi:hypothetical protein
MMSDEGVCYRICQVYAPSLLWDTMRLIMCDTYAAACVLVDKSSISSQLNKLRGVSLLDILQECGELERVMPWAHEKA